MGIRLVVEVLDHAPPGLTAAERLVLVVLAEQARDTTRQAYPGREVLLRRTGLGARGLQHTFERLARRGLEIRVPVGTDATGRPLYAFAGQRTIYRLPEFAAEDGRLTGRPNGRPEGQPMDDSEVRGGRRVGRPMGDSEVAPSPHRSLSPSAGRADAREPAQHIKTVMQATGADVEEAAAVAGLVAAEKAPDNLGGFLRRLAADGELDGWLARVRAERARAGRADFRVWIAGQPKCEHGVAGGHIEAPDGWVACPIERWARGPGPRDGHVR